MKRLQKISLDTLKKSTLFERKVYRETLHIPFGKVKTYKEIAKAIKHPLAYRAVGQALKKNPLPFIVPCHRVIKSDGDIGGYVYGKNIKKKLLRLEREFSKDFL